jgi:tRNA (guanine-N7-)-methyltransferase
VTPEPISSQNVSTEPDTADTADNADTAETDAHVPYGRHVSFVRRGGRVTSGQERALRELSGEYLVEVPRGYFATSVDPQFHQHPDAWFGRNARLTVEVGSGQGHQIVHAAKSHTDENFLALEVFLGGIARTMVLAEEHGVHNVRLVEVNAPELLEHVLPESSVDELWVFFPDPWHKARHHKRRLINADFAQLAARVLKTDGVIRLATDWEDYALQMREVFDDAAEFARDFSGEWAPRFEGRIFTAFEKKGADKQRFIRDLAYRRTDEVPAFG